MKSIYIAASVIFFALACPAHSAEGEPGRAATSQSGGRSVGQSIKSTAREVGHGIKNGARQLKAGVKSGARQFKRTVAVAQCNNGEYSYTHHKTCNHNGGVREKLR
jgi:hypothetical protein